MKCNSIPFSSQGVCKKCDPSCLTCKGPGPGNCVTCQPGPFALHRPTSKCVPCCIPNAYDEDACCICRNPREKSKHLIRRLCIDPRRRERVEDSKLPRAVEQYGHSCMIFSVVNFVGETAARVFALTVSPLSYASFSHIGTFPSAERDMGHYETSWPGGEFRASIFCMRVLIPQTF